ncbi:MAG: translocation/assembly module TamB, partial [Muribaculaceae bacterium]|nr:translocation/assembly module TamB [Muribaculaceae bacterium]
PIFRESRGSVYPRFDIPSESYSLAASASGNGLNGHADIKAAASTDNVDIHASYRRLSLSSPIDFSANGSVDVADLSAIIHKPGFGQSALAFEATGRWHNTLISADASLNIDRITYKGYPYSDISADAAWHSGDFKLDAIISDPQLTIDLTAGGRLGIKSLRDSVNLQAAINGFNPAILNLSKTNLTLNADIDASLSDFNPANIEGFLSINNLSLTDSVGDSYSPGPFKVTASGSPDNRLIELSGDFIKGRINGAVNPVSLPLLFSTIASRAFPALGNDADDAKLKRLEAQSPNIFNFDFTLQPTESLRNIVNPPVTSLYPVTLSGNVDSSSGSARVVVDAPYLRQGNKIIEATRLEVIANGISSAKQLSLTTKYPSKDGLTNVNLKASGIGNSLNLGMDFKIDRAARYDGQVKLSAKVGRSDTDNSPTALVKILPSEVTFNDSTWFISPSTLNWADRQLSIDHLEVSRQNQFVKIDGVASASEDDVVNIDIRNFDLGYLFNALNIDNVPLGGYTTGSVTANSVLTPAPHASATDLFVRDISFSDCIIGDAIVNSHFEPDNMAIIIDGNVTQADGNHSTISVDLRPMSKELDVNINAIHTPVGFLQRYFYAFADNISGTASGNLRIFGTFENVDLEGRMEAEDVDMRLLFTNVRYQASDSIIITPGRISLPALAINDPSTGHKATLSGYVTHRNFSDFKINLSLDHIRDMLVFDVKPSDESNYYGHVLGSGHASITGDENLIDIKVDATTSAGSMFTFILDDREVASEYTFLTFRDKNAVTDTVKVVVDEHLQNIDHLRSLFKNKIAPTDGNFNVELQVNVTPEAELDLVMDPVAGDKIKAFGNADLRITYSSATDEMEMFGTYTADRGFYNFTLQEIIIKDFIIEQGSEVVFSGDPLNARLKIKAYYSLNANLTDLDETFANDKDLNRTNVPVHAVLLVDGDIDNPQLSFDIEFPTLTSDVYRKVRSIVSTEEMMNRQIIYLLALNRFYTPDYMSATKGNELFSVASSTITSQLSNILGQLSDKWMIAPNLRSDRGDFSDVEVDVALSSRLLNNRLLLNGNFGYRDKSLNTNQFIGDFDIEYLLNRQGSIRLKAYNHYNDQNYYVRTANTTQGVGIMFKHDFDNIFGFLRRIHHPATIHPADSTVQPIPSLPADSLPNQALDPLPQ